SEQEERPLPPDGIARERDDPDRRDREQESERELDRERGTDIRLIRELGHHRRELCGVGDDRDPPHDAQTEHEQRRSAEDKAREDRAGARYGHSERGRAGPSPPVAEEPPGEAA